MFDWLFHSRKRRREIAHNCAVAESASISPVCSEGSPSTFLIVVREELKSNEIAWFVRTIDRRINAMCAEDMERYERQRLGIAFPTKPLLQDAKRVVMCDHGTALRNSHVFVMQWTPTVHYNLG
ncbi:MULTISPECIES: hypothetical protein [Pandoraea]|uniref:hypothetical protein n=1 Tax=Pandoraea TaxID=93217 RepID=UPI001240AC91|nr:MULTISPECIES: hypothetical protein [Pandoraea]